MEAEPIGGTPVTVQFSKPLFLYLTLRHLQVESAVVHPQGRFMSLLLKKRHREFYLRMSRFECNIGSDNKKLRLYFRTPVRLAPSWYPIVRLTSPELQKVAKKLQDKSLQGWSSGKRNLQTSFLWLLLFPIIRNVYFYGFLQIFN